MKPPIRSAWVKKRGGPVVTQMHYARRGIITEEMTFVAQREKLSPDLIRSEILDSRKIEFSTERRSCAS